MKRPLASCVAAAALAIAAGAQAQGYVDRVLEEGPQPALPSPDPKEDAGWPRGWRVETSVADDRGSQRATYQALSVSGFLDTPNHGALSFNGAISRARATSEGGLRGEAQSLGLWRVDQARLPLDGGWYAFHSAGHLNSVHVPLARGFGRLGLPSSPIAGVTAQYERGMESQVNFTAGRPGVYSGLGISGFEASSGRLLGAGAQHHLAGTGSTYALQYLQASGLGSLPGQPGVDDVAGLWGAWRWQGTAPWSAAGDPPLEAQVNAMSSRTQFLPGVRGEERAQAVWADARWRTGWLEHSAGLFHLDPGLRWGSFSAASDLRGAYWRTDFSSRQWQLGTLLEVSRSVSGHSEGGHYASANARYRVDTRHSLVGNVAIRRGDGAGESLQLGWEHEGDLGLTQWRADLLRAEARRATRLGMDHSFRFASDSALAVGLGWVREDDEGFRKNTLDWGVIGSLRPWSAVSLDANLHGSHGDERSQIQGNLGVAWRLNTQWTLLGQLNYTRGRDVQKLTIVSPLTQAAESALVSNAFSARRVQLTLRYEERAGRLYAPLGGTPGSGAGAVAGHVFFDTNDNGRRDPGETGVADVVVRLDGRFIARTDAQGFYEFISVAAGTHTVDVVADNVPLPWSPPAGAARAEVRVRATTTQDFPLRRDR